MPSTSRKQHRFMEAIAHSPEFAKKAGVPQKVGKDFAAADKREGKFKPKQPDTKEAHMARRKERSGKTYAQVAKEFGTSKSTVHRKHKAEMMRQGFNRLGSAD